MGQYFCLIIPELKVASKEASKESTRHCSIAWDKNGCSFTAAAGLLFLIQEYIREAGCKANAINEDELKDCNTMLLNDIVTLVQKQVTPVTLFIGQETLSSCVHESPCSPSYISHQCYWGEQVPVMRELCDQCPYFIDDKKIYNGTLTKATILCGHPEAYLNLVSPNGD